MDANESLHELTDLGDLELGRWEKFAHFSDAPNLGNKLGYHVYSFRRGAEVLVSKWTESSDHTLDLPVAYLCRHYVELALKSLCEEARTIGSGAPEPPAVHGLSELWRPTRVFLQNIGIVHNEDDYLLRFEEVIEFLDKIDGRSVVFRYPLNKRKWHVVIDIPKLWGAIQVCDTVFCGLSTEIDQYCWYLSDKYQNT